MRKPCETATAHLTKPRRRQSLNMSESCTPSMFEEGLWTWSISSQMELSLKKDPNTKPRPSPTPVDLNNDEFVSCRDFRVWSESFWGSLHVGGQPRAPQALPKALRAHHVQREAPEAPLVGTARHLGRGTKRRDRSLQPYVYE